MRQLLPHVKARAAIFGLRLVVGVGNGCPEYRLLAGRVRVARGGLAYLRAYLDGYSDRGLHEAWGKP